MSDFQSRGIGVSRKQAPLERTFRDKTAVRQTEPIGRRASGTRPQLSFAQNRLWFLDHLQRGSPAYNVFSVFRIEGPLNTTALTRALTAVVRRHEVLRTTFASDSTGPVPVIHPPSQFKTNCIDLTAMPAAEKEAEAAKLIRREVSWRFDLVHGPLFRATLLALDPVDHLLIFNFHHIVSDGWSWGVLYKDLSNLYEAFAGDRPSPLSELSIQYTDYAVWQRTYLEGERLDELLTYWRETLRDVPTLDLPTDRPRPPAQTFAGAVSYLHLPAAVIANLKALARQEGATLFMALLAGFQILLHRYSGQDDIIVGVPSAGRTRLEMEPLIGLFVNVLVLRTSLSRNPTYRSFLGRVKEASLGAYAHQEIPFDKLVEQLHPLRDPGRNPLYQVLFAFQNTPGSSLSLAGLKTQKVEADEVTIRFDLEVHLLEAQDGLNAMFVYNIALFESDTVARMSEHYRTLLEGIVSNPDQRVSHLPILTKQERQQLLVAANETTTDYPGDFSIGELFALQAEAFPNQTAVAFGAQSLSYRELNTRANQVAHHLRSLGVGTDVLVGVCAERSIDLIVGFLSILKAGGAYVPLDPSHPRDRLAFMLEDANVPVLLTQEKIRSSLPETRAHVICLDTESFKDMPQHNPPWQVLPSHLAYVIYTSGSTGQPKGVAVPHRAVIRVVLNTNYVQLTATDRLTQVCNASFDVAAFEIWGALLNGATLIGIPQSVLLSPKELAREIAEQKITVLFLTPALFNQVANAIPSAFRSLRYVLVAGDVFDPKSARRVLQHGAPENLVNVYGPTECTVFATAYRVERVDESASSIPIGRPISNTSVYVLDRNLQPVPIGVVGELYLGGDGLARGYLNRPELTAEKFIPHPFTTEPSQRLYRTGDFVRYQADGNIDFLGRSDNQVKLRGFRIELQEIETLLAQHASVSTCVVIARSTEEGDKRLLAYIVPSSGTRVSAEELRHFLRRKLPEYMIPAAFITRDALPLTPNGKVDYSALPSPEHADEDNRLLVEPRTSIEHKLAGMWKKILGNERIGIHENFFDLGGHSLLAIQLIAHIEREFRIVLPVAILFQYPTIAELAKVLTAETWPQSWSSLIPVQPKGSRVPFFWVHGDSSNAILPEYLEPDQPLYALEHQGLDGRPAVYTDVETIAKHYLSEVRNVQPVGPYLLGGFSFGAVAALEMAHQLRQIGEEVPLLFILDPPASKESERPLLPPMEELRKHRRELSYRKAREKLHYLGPRFRDRFLPRVGRIRKAVTRLRWKCYLATGRRLPASLRSEYILDVYKQALASYEPKPYSGSVTFYKAQNARYTPPGDWLKAMTGELELFEGPGDHMDQKKEPYVAQWVQHLKAALDRVNNRRA